MLKSLMAVIGLNSAPYNAGLAQAVNSARIAGVRIGEGLSGGTVSLNIALREILVLLREIGRGNWSRVPGSLSILIQSLGIMRFILNPLTLALVALGGAAALMAHWLNRSVVAANDLSQAIVGPTNRFLALADAMERVKLKALEFQARMKRMREEAYGDDEEHPATIAQAKERFEQRLAQEKAAQEALEGQEKEHPLEILKKRATEIGEQSAKLREEFDAARKRARETSGPVRLYYGGKAISLANPLLHAEVAYREAQAAYEKALEDQTSKQEVLSEARSKSEKALAALKHLQETSADVTGGKVTTDASLIHGSVNALQAVGAYASPATVALIDVNKKIERNTREMKDLLKSHASGKGNFHPFGALKG